MKKVTNRLMCMRFIGLACAVMIGAGSVWAVPACPGWRVVTQADGTEIEVMLCGDERYHYTLNRAGEQVRLNASGMYEVVGEAPDAAQVAVRRASSPMGVRRMKQEFGVTPNPAPKGVVILANFRDSKMQDAHTPAVFGELCNSGSCTVNAYKGVLYGSAAQYFADQSGGKYRPQFDVFGPVTLSKGYAYYGQDTGVDVEKYAADAVVEACILANEQYDSLNFADYDSDGDGYVDFVYVIYAGRGQADGGSQNTIWPHNWELDLARSEDACSYSKEDCLLDGKYVNNYACSSELEGSGLTGIGTLCHEFGHVLGLPDLYDTGYSTNHNYALTPNQWDIMDVGSHNGGGHCPPNFDPWEKYFFGWVDPVNPGNKAADIVLKPNGAEEYNVCQVNASGVKQGAAESGLCYYMENRQKTGWDEFIPAAGMVVWVVDYDSAAWRENEPNNVANHPLLTIVCSSGTQVGSKNGSGNVFPNGDVTSWTGVEGKPVTDIAVQGEYITLRYMGGVDDSTTLTESVAADGNGHRAEKVLRDGRLVIRVPGRGVYDAAGVRME